MTQFDDSIPLTFRLMRKADVSGTSGTGHVADGVQFPDGTCVLRWRTANSSTAVYASHADLMAIHGHDGATVCEWSITTAACLNGPSPAEVAALLRIVEWTLAHDGEDACPCCHATRPEGHDDCKFDAMIKQCEGA